jgi:Leucine-rich repeat (LRR) protein
MTDIEIYLNSLHDNITHMHISFLDITYFPDITRFKKLETLYCCHNKITSLPTLPENLKNLSCSYNKLTSLPTLPKNLQTLYCCFNQLTSLPNLPKNLKILNCSYNHLTSIPNAPENLHTLYCKNNPIYQIINNVDLIIVKQNINLLNNFRYSYFCVKFKRQFRKWLWEKIREPRLIKKYSPDYLIKHNVLDENTNLDIILENWEI